MKKWIATLGSMAVILSMATAAAAQNMTVDFDRSAPFSSYRTYGWTMGSVTVDELSHKRIIQAIESQLRLKGLARVNESAGPDVLVTYHVAFDRNLEINASGFGGYRYARSGVARVEHVVLGTIVVEVIDARSGSVVWRGTATKEIDAKASAEKRDKNLNKAAEKLFKQYPAAH